MPWTTCLWPGLPQLWIYGSWTGLALALGTAAGFDLLVLASFGWSELIAPGLRSGVWVAFGVFWVAAAGWSMRQGRRRLAAEELNPRENGFTEALDHYLKGDYYQAEHVLEELLRRNLRDVDARLMLATLLRHTGRLDEATRELDTLVRLEGAGKWQWEIERERVLLAETKTESVTAA
jgi:tetratricopeptide (TPR) repeat protein